VPRSATISEPIHCCCSPSLDYYCKIYTLRKNRVCDSSIVYALTFNLGLIFLFTSCKVVAVFWDRTTHKMEGRVHCMGYSCWRKTLDCPAFPILLRTSKGPFVNGSVNWLALHNLNCNDDYKWENVTIQ